MRRAIEESVHQTGVVEELSSVPEILGQAPAMQEVFRAIGRLAQSHATVLINGESGTGKELVALALHRHSPRCDAPFIAINTAAIPRDLLESELFGHERGAFTGATTLRRGRFEQADGGTLFLDEIGDMPAELQTRLLRVLSDGHFYRVGGQQPVRANVRVIAATHQDLDARVRQGLFREDLFHRLNVIRLRLPALRERREDIPLLLRHFLRKSAHELGVECKRVADTTVDFLQHQPFPGNVRQLENLCHWLTVMAPAQVISLQDLPPEVLEAPVYQPPVRATAGAEPAAATVTSMPVAPLAPVAPVAQPAPELVGGVHPAAPVPIPVSVPATPASWSADAVAAPVAAAHGWEQALETEAQKLLAGGQPEVWDALTRRFESRLIRTALVATHGRRMEAAQRLGIGRNTITRKIQELGLDAPDEA